MIVAALTSSLAGFEKFMPSAGVADGNMRLLIYTKFEIFGIVDIISKLLSGHLDESAYVNVMTIKRARITVEGNEPLSTNVDGDRGPELPLEIEVLPSFVQVYAPEEKRKREGLFGLELGSVIIGDVACRLLIP